MRIISGQWRHRTIQAPPGQNTRPMPDRVRQAVLETVGSRLGTPSRLPPIRVLDLFAGSGSVGLEALSRGAVWCGFVEADRGALAMLRRNIASLQADRVSRVIAADAFDVYHWCRSIPRESCELVFVDPPYRDTRDPTDGARVARFLVGLAESPVLAEGAHVVLRHESKATYDQRLYGNLRPVDVRRYGSMT